MPEAYKIPCEEYDRLVRRVEAVEKENAELRARVAELEKGKFGDPVTYGFADFSKLLEGGTVTISPTVESIDMTTRVD